MRPPLSPLRPPLTRPRRRAAATVVACAALAAPDARAQTEPPRGFVAAGAATPVVNYQELYDAGLVLRSGLDQAWPGAPARHRLRPQATFLIFPSEGAQLYLATIEAAWRLYVVSGRGLYGQLSAGALLGRERLALALPSRTLHEGLTRLGVPLSASVGWSLAGVVDIELSYRHDFFATHTPRTAGYLAVTLGVRP